MAHFMVIYSKYFITLFLFLFLACGVWALCQRRGQDMIANVQSVFLFLTLLFAYLTVLIRTGRREYLILYAFLQLLTLALPVLASLLYPGVSRVVCNHMCMLLGAGVLILTRLNFDRATRQLAIAAVACVAGLFLPWFFKRYRKLLRSAGWGFMAVGILVLGAVTIWGQVTRGSKLSVSLFGFAFQPSEFIKILYVLFLASVLDKDSGILRIFLAGLGAAAHVLLLVVSRDLGSALIYFVVYVAMITIAAHQPLYLLLGTLAGGIASVGAYRLFSHVQVRFQAWKDPWSVIDNQGYQITQSLFAMSRGGLFGLGIGKGTPSDIPYVDTDFIFSAVVEEMGLLFGMGVIGVGIVLFLLVIQLAGSIKDGFVRNLTAGYAVLFLFQTFLTVGGGSKFIPLTGVTLPFISYGGSSVTATILMFFLVQGVFVLRHDEEMKLEKQRKKKAKQEKESGRKEQELV